MTGCPCSLLVRDQRKEQRFTPYFPHTSQPHRNAGQISDTPLKRGGVSLSVFAGGGYKLRGAINILDERLIQNLECTPRVKKISSKDSTQGSKQKLEQKPAQIIRTLAESCMVKLATFSWEDSSSRLNLRICYEQIGK